MATIKKTGDYGVVEFNQIAALKTGQIEAQLPLDATAFATTNAENGMVVVADRVAGKVVKPTNDAAKGLYLVASAERVFDSVRKVRLADFAGISKDSKEYARLYFLNVGDTYTTNQVECGARTNFAGIAVGDAFVAANTGIVAYKATLAGTEGTVLRVIKKTTLPDGVTDAVCLEVVSN